MTPRIPNQPAPRIQGPELEARILHESADLLVLDKPAGLPTSGRSLGDDDCVQYALMHRAGGMVWAVHQLDADTSGINLFTTRKANVARLKSALQDAAARKEYIALVHGEPSWTSVLCEQPIGPIEGGSLGVAADGKSAASEFMVESKGGGFARIRARIRTGRTHQIRIHLSHLGHPLVGEEWYREPACTLHTRQALHAARLVLPPPVDLSFESPLPPDLERLADQLARH